MACLLILLLCLCWLAWDAASRRATAREEAQSETILSEDILACESDEPEIFDYFLPLLEENPDIVGLVGVADKTMYVCQTDNNRYYMNHRFDGTEDDAGTIFLDCRCWLWPASDNLILYGHNRRDGSRFGGLKRYLDVEYLLEHSTIRLATLYELRDFEPIAVFRATVGAFNWEINHFENCAEFERFIDEARNRSEVNLPAKVSFGTPILTLVTCSGRAEDERLILICAQKHSPDR